MGDYDLFLTQLRDPESAPLTSQLKSFLRAFASQKKSIPEQRKGVNRFLEHIYAETLQNPVFSQATSDEELENIREGWEKLLMIKIHDQVFGAPDTDEGKMTSYLARKIDQFQWVQERHLDLPFHVGSKLEVVQGELLRVNGFRCPKDKLTILMNTIQMVVDILQKQKESAGNDHLLPVLILAVIRANPPALISNVKYIMRFRSQTELDKGPVQFCLTSMMGAISFIYNMKLNSLTLAPEEIRQYSQLGSKLQPPPARSDAPQSNATKTSSANAPPATSSSNIASPVPTHNNLSNLYSSTLKMFDNTAVALKSAAETAAVTVDGFAQGLMERFREDGNSPPTNNSAAGSTVSLNLEAGTKPPTPRPADDASPALGSGAPTGTPNPARAASPLGWIARLSGARASPAQPPSQTTGTLISTADEDASQRRPSITGATDDLKVAARRASSDRFSSQRDREQFETALSDAERGVLEDYDLQLALALSLSIEEGKGDGEFETLPPGVGVGTGSRGSSPVRPAPQRSSLSPARSTSPGGARPSSPGRKAPLVDVAVRDRPPRGMEEGVDGATGGDEDADDDDDEPLKKRSPRRVTFGEATSAEEARTPAVAMTEAGESLI
ncbi:hypothetical protein HK101_003349 [Irineochytrium annulatum]|nr:hypothetical protein HK101_003349 [Irineochytrium annulatum]